MKSAPHPPVEPRALLRAASLMVQARGIPVRALWDSWPTSRRDCEQMILTTFDGAGVVRVFDEYRLLVRSHPGRQGEIDFAREESERAARWYLDHALRLASIREPEPYVIAWFDNSSQVNAPRLIKWTYRPGVLSVHDSFTGEVLCESLPGQPEDLNDDIGRALAKTDVPPRRSGQRPARSSSSATTQAKSS